MAKKNRLNWFSVFLYKRLAMADYTLSYSLVISIGKRYRFITVKMVNPDQ
jgi:hypothetical protein